jgi:hypothetical protein
MNVPRALPAGAANEWDRKFRDDLAADAAFEAGLSVKELCVLAIIVALVLLRELFL